MEWKQSTGLEENLDGTFANPQSCFWILFLSKYRFGPSDFKQFHLPEQLPYQLKKSTESDWFFALLTKILSDWKYLIPLFLLVLTELKVGRVILPIKY